VTATLKPLERDGWITTEQGKDIRLTDKGCIAARSVIRRHFLTKWMIVHMLKVHLSLIHAEADQIEHTISEEIETQMRTNLDGP
jgi:DtxR family Mn-dependent transcriptional regulator